MFLSSNHALGVLGHASTPVNTPLGEAQPFMSGRTDTKVSADVESQRDWVF